MAATQRTLAIGLTVGAALLAAGYVMLTGQRQRLAESLARFEAARVRLPAQLEPALAIGDPPAGLEARMAKAERDNRRLAPAPRRAEPATRLAPLDAAALHPLAGHPPAVEPAALTELLPASPPLIWPAAANAVTPVPAWPDAAPRHDALMKKLYVGFVALQGIDTATTIASTRMGAREVNPLFSGVANDPVAVVAIKSGVVIGTLFAMERLRLKNPMAAAVMMTAVNSALIVIAVNNTKTIAQQRRE